MVDSKWIINGSSMVNPLELWISPMLMVDNGGFIVNDG